MKPKQIQAIELLAQGSTVEATATITGVNRRTVYTWLNNPEFKLALHDRNAETIDRINHRMVALNDKALDVIEACLNSRVEAIRLRTACYLNSKLYDVLEIAELLKHIESIEEKLTK